MSNSHKLFAKAEKLLQKQKLNSALDAFRKLLKTEPRNETVLRNLADLSLKVGRNEEFLRYNRLLADIYLERNELSKAIASCRKVLKAGYQDANTLRRLASMLQKARKTTEALGAFVQAAELHCRNSQAAQAIECLQQAVDLKPESVDALVKIAGLAAQCNDNAFASEAFLKAAEFVRTKQMEDRWIELAELAYQSNPENEAGRIAAAEACLARGRAQEAIDRLQPMSSPRAEQADFLQLLCRAYLGAGDLDKAESICQSLDQSHPATFHLTEKLIQAHLSAGHTERTLSLVERIKTLASQNPEKKAQFTALVERIYHADENNLAVLELLPPLYNDLNRESDLCVSLTRLFDLYLAAEHYHKAAETLERILDVDPYAPGHSDRLLNLEGHIDAIWYGNIGSRISLPGAGQTLEQNSLIGPGDKAEFELPSTLEELVIEGEMYLRYHLTEKLDKTLKTIDSLYPGSQANNESLRDLYAAAGFQPTAVNGPLEPDFTARPHDANGPVTPANLSPEQLDRLSAITGIVHHQTSVENILAVAVEQLGRLIKANRCWIALGPPDAALPLTAEYHSTSVHPSNPAASHQLWSFLAHQGSGGEDWSLDDVLAAKQLTPVAEELQLLRIRSLLAIPLTDKEQPAGLLLIEQCEEIRRWTSSERMLAKTLASQVMVAVNTTKLRRLVRSLAGSDAATGLLPRSAYIDCVLEQARQAKEQSRPLSLCLLEPARVVRPSRTLLPAELRSCFQRLASSVSQHIRQNDFVIRYGPCTIALCLPDTPLAQCKAIIEKLEGDLKRGSLNKPIPVTVCATLGALFLGKGFDAVDSVTEVINRLDRSLQLVRKHPETAILVSDFPG